MGGRAGACWGVARCGGDSPELPEALRVASWRTRRPKPGPRPPDLARAGACLRTSGRTGTLKKGTAPIVDVHPHLEETP